MALTVRKVPLKDLPNIWQQAEDLLKLALVDTDAEYSISEIKRFIDFGAWDLYIAEDKDGKLHGATAIAFSKTDSDCIAFILAIGGRLITREETFGQLKSQLFSQGVTRIHGIVNENVARLTEKIGFTKKAFLVELKR